MDRSSNSHDKSQSGASLRYQQELLPIAILIGTLSVYYLTLSPTINSFDSAELITGAYTLGIVHSPGYPLYLLLAHIATRLPWGNIPSNVNFLSALFSALAVTITYQSCRQISNSPWSSVLAAAVLAFSSLFWSQAVIAEVYALNALLVSGVVYLGIRYLKQPTARLLIGLSFILGLSFTNHPSVVLLAPGLAIAVLLNRKNISHSLAIWVAAFTTFLLPLLLYLYLPLRFMAEPDLNYVADYFTKDLTTVRGFIWMVTGQMFSQEMFGRPLNVGLNEVIQLVRLLWRNFLGAGLFLAIWGLYRLRKQKSLTVFLGTGTFLVVLFFAFYNVIDSHNMIVPALILITPAVANGIMHLWTDVLGRGRTFSDLLILKGVVIFVIMLLLAINWVAVDRSNDWATYQLANGVMEEVEDDAFILTQWTVATPLHYLQLVEKIRPNVTIFDRGLMALGIRDAFPEANGVASEQLNDIMTERLVTVVKQALRSRPVYVTEDDPFLRNLFCYYKKNEGLYQITSVGSDCKESIPGLNNSTTQQ